MFGTGNTSNWLGLVLAGTGLLFAIEPTIALLSPHTYEAVNRARRERRFVVLAPAGLFLGAWGLICLFTGLPPRQFAHWLLVILGSLCMVKAVATLLFAKRLAQVSEDFHASGARRRLRGVAGLVLSLGLISWGVLILRNATA